jgi:hypothetical protein
MYKQLPTLVAPLMHVLQHCYVRLSYLISIHGWNIRGLSETAYCVGFDTLQALIACSGLNVFQLRTLRK